MRSTGGMPLSRVGRRRLRTDLLWVTNDLLVVWNIAVVALTGYGSALLDIALFGPVGSASFVADAGCLALVGALLSPLMLIDRAPRLRADGLVETALHSIRQAFTLAAVLLATGVLTRSVPDARWSWALLWAVTGIAGRAAGQYCHGRVVQRLRRRGLLTERVALAGGGAVAEQLRRHINRSGDTGVRLVGVFDDILSSGDPKSDRSLRQVVELAQRDEVDRVVLTLPATDKARMFEIVYRLKALDVQVAHCPTLATLSEDYARPADVAGAPVMVLAERPISRRGTIIKGVEDRILAALAIVVLAPLLLVLAVAVRLDSPGPVIFRQRRHGWNGTEFQVFKFRTMRTQAGAGSGEVQTRRNDSRITRMGALLRSTSLDELPQLFNVLNGTMSLVGPRPHPVVMRTEQQLGEEIIAEYSHRHRVRPGITGWAQINGHRGATETAEQVRKRVEHDIYYIDNWSLLFDLKILVLTPYKILFNRENAF